LISSEVIDAEISKILDHDKRQKVEILAEIHQTYTIVNEFIEKRAIDLEKLTFKSYDALHIACAEKSGADVFLTTDDLLIKKALENRDILRVRVHNPLRWLMEVI